MCKDVRHVRDEARVDVSKIDGLVFAEVHQFNFGFGLIFVSQSFFSSSLVLGCAYFNGEELERELHKAMQRLPEKQRMVFALRYFEQMKYEDIAQITDTSVGALKTSYHIAYKKISEELKQIFG